MYSSLSCDKMCTRRSSSATGLWARARSSAIDLISWRYSEIEWLPLGSLIRLDLSEMMRDRVPLAKLEFSRSQASREVVADEISG